MTCLVVRKEGGHFFTTHLVVKKHLLFLYDYRMARSVSVSASGGLLSELRATFGLAQAQAGRLLGATQPQLSAAETGRLLLPASASPRLRALQAARQAVPAPLPPPDLAPLRDRRAQCLAQAERLAVRLAHELPARAAVVRARLGAATALPAALAAVEADEPLPPRAREDQLGELTQLLNNARTEWEEGSGPTPTALLRARQAGLLAEAAALEAELTTLEVEKNESLETNNILTLPPRLFSSFSLYPFSFMPGTYSLTALETRADCAAALTPLRLRRDEAAADVSALSFDLQVFGDSAARKAEITRLNTKLTNVQTDLLTLPEGKEKRDAENDMAGFLRRRNQLVGQSETHGGDDKVLLEFKLEMARQTAAEATALVAAIEARQPTLSA